MLKPQDFFWQPKVQPFCNSWFKQCLQNVSNWGVWKGEEMFFAKGCFLKCFRPEACSVLYVRSIRPRYSHFQIDEGEIAVTHSLACLTSLWPVLRAACTSTVSSKANPWSQGGVQGDSLKFCWNRSPASHVPEASCAQPFYRGWCQRRWWKSEADVKGAGAHWLPVALLDHFGSGEKWAWFVCGCVKTRHWQL